MKQIKTGEHTGTVCEFCEQSAKWRANWYYRSMYACNDHKAEIQKAERAWTDDWHISDADAKTWLSI